MLMLLSTPADSNEYVIMTYIALLCSLAFINLDELLSGLVALGKNSNISTIMKK